MTQFKYKAIDSKGTESVDIIEATNESTALEQLNKRHLTVIEISSSNSQDTPQAAPLLKNSSRAPIDLNIPIRNVLGFYEQLSFLITSGIPLHLGLRMAIDNLKDENLQEVLKWVLYDLKEGAPLSSALGKFPKLFPNLHCQLIAVGEKAGNLDVLLTHLVDLVTEQLDIRQKVVKAISYPIFLLSVSTVLVSGMIVVVFPRFADVFSSFKVKLPPTTTFLMETGKYVQNNFATTFGTLGLVIFGLVYFFRSPTLSEVRDQFLLKLPVIRDVWISMFISLFSKMMASLLNAGIPLLEALTICRQSMRGGLKDAFFEDLIRATREGEPMSQVMQRTHIIPELAWQLVAVGEQTGNQGKMMDSIFTFYKKKYADLLLKLTTVLGPVMMVLSSSVIAVVAMSIFLPLFKLGSSIRGGG